MKKVAQKRARTTKHTAPLSIPLDHTITSIKWPLILTSLRKNHRLQQRRARVRPILSRRTPIVIDRPIVDNSVETGSPGVRGPLQLRRVLANVRFSGLTGRIQGQIDHLIRAFRRFLTNATNIELTRWWSRLHRQLPEPYFFLVYAALKAVV